MFAVIATASLLFVTGTPGMTATVTATTTSARTAANDQRAEEAYCLLAVNFGEKFGYRGLGECLQDATSEKVEGMVCSASRAGTCVNAEWLLRRVSGFVVAVGDDLAWGKSDIPQFDPLPFANADEPMHSGLEFLREVEKGEIDETKTKTDKNENVGEFAEAEIAEIRGKILVAKEEEKLEEEKRKLETAKTETYTLHTTLHIVVGVGVSVISILAVAVVTCCQRRCHVRQMEAMEERLTRQFREGLANASSAV